MPLGRAFSFEDRDDRALSSEEQEHRSYQNRNNDYYPDYHDSPSRVTVSPPPQYSSAPPPRSASPVSPTSPLRHINPSGPPDSTHYQDSRPAEISRKPLPPRNSSGSPEPPPPPPHGRPPLEPPQDGFSRQRQDRWSGPDSNMSQRMNQAHPELRPRDSYASNVPLAAGAATPGMMTPRATPDLGSSGASGRSIPLDDYPSAANHMTYHDSPYQTSSLNLNPDINPQNIADDGDDGFIPDPKRRSVLALGRPQNDDSNNPAAAARAAKSASIAGAIGGLLGRNQRGQASSGSYDRVHTNGSDVERAEKSEWLARQSKGANKMRWVVGLAIGAVIVLAITGGIIGGVLGSRRSASSGSGNSDNTATGDQAANGDLGLDSPEIQSLLNNPNLHKVFPGIDYTPWGTQYPLCLTYPPSQNNVTRDMAVLSQLTNAVRLYGTDCNQTEMVLHAIDRLQLSDMKVWLGVWIDPNQTTTDRQLAQMYDVMENTRDLSIFNGAIIGNEALFRAGEDKASSEQNLIQILTDVKSNFTAKGYKMPVTTSDLGDNWNQQLAEVADIVMANIHPFFAGVTSGVAAAWTWDFWQNHDVALTQGTNKRQIIAETGWPSTGGTDCGGTTGDCAPGQSGSVASIDGMNEYMDSWVCQAMANGTEYFWFEAFDEPWKIIYDTPGKDWEDKWGLMDAARNLKPGLKIPDCGGKTAG